MRLEVVTTPITLQQEQDINAFLSVHSYNTIFQSPSFFSYYYSQSNYFPNYFLSYDSEVLVGLLLAVTINEGHSLFANLIKRCVIQGGPIVKDDNPDVLSLLLQALNKSLKKSIFITQFRNYRVWNDKALKVFSDNGFDLHDHLNLIIRDTNPDIILKGMSTSRRRQIRKGLASGATLKPATSLSEVSDLYKILLKLYQEKVKKPLPKWEFFEQFFTQLVPEGRGAIMLVYYNEKIIGGIFSPVTQGKMMYELYICGLHKEYPRQYPGVLATWAALDWASKNNIQSFDFMGLGKPDVPYGVRDFKLRFGGEQVNYGRFRSRNYQFIYSIAETGYNVLRRLKWI